MRGKPEPGSSSSLCCRAAGSFPPGWGCSNKGKRMPLPPGTPGTLALRHRPQHTVRLYGRRAACPSHNFGMQGATQRGT